jgi:hypothetical protein
MTAIKTKKAAHRPTLSLCQDDLAPWPFFQILRSDP